MVDPLPRKATIEAVLGVVRGVWQQGGAGDAGRPGTPRHLHRSALRSPWGEKKFQTAARSPQTRFAATKNNQRRRFGGSRRGAAAGRSRGCRTTQHPQAFAPICTTEPRGRRKRTEYSHPPHARVNPHRKNKAKKGEEVSETQPVSPLVQEELKQDCSAAESEPLQALAGPCGLRRYDNKGRRVIIFVNIFGN
jgi:hypothetical protein